MVDLTERLTTAVKRLDAGGWDESELDVLERAAMLLGDDINLTAAWAHELTQEVDDREAGEAEMRSQAEPDVREYDDLPF
jgi:hypothetical protein